MNLNEISAGYQHLYPLHQRARTAPARYFLTKVDNEIAVSSITKAEMFYGSAKSQTPDISRAKQEQFFSRFISLPFDDQASLVYGKIRSDLERLGKPIGQLDTLIAAIALANNLILVTHNVGEFSRITGLKIEDWESQNR